MRKFIVLAISLFFGNYLYVAAQPSITASALPSVGEIIQISTVSQSNLSQGATGANASWDFSNLNSGSTVSASVVAASSTSQASLFSGSSIAVAYNPGLTFGSVAMISHEYLSGGGDGLINHGFVTSDLTINYSDPQTTLSFPFTYLDQNTDQFAAAYEVGGSMLDRSGTVTTIADGYGTLILPYGTIENVLRVKIIQDYSDSINGEEFFKYFTETYAWYSPDLAYPLLVISSEVVEGSPQPAVSTVYYAESPAVNYQPVGVEDLSPIVSEFVSSPNPARDFGQISYQLIENAPVQLSIFNAVGQKVSTLVDEKYQAVGAYSTQVDWNNYPKGLYIAQLLSGNRTYSQKIVIQ